MEAFNSNIIERHQPPRRNDSFSTVNSSVAADLMQQFSNTNLDAGRSQILGDGIPSNNQTSMKFERSEGVHVGDIINNYYTPPVNVTNESKPRKVAQSNYAHNSSVSENFTKAKRRFFQGENRRRNIWIATVFISTILSIIGVVIYFILIISKPKTDFTTVATDFTTTSTTTDFTTTSTTTIDHNTTTFIPNDFEFLIARNAWDAVLPKNLSFSLLSLPIKRIIIAHTGGSHCDNEIACKILIKNLQTQAFESELNDIAFNFLIGDDGYIYEGRGFQILGEHTENIYATEYNSIGICIAFIGNYLNFSPSSNQIDVLKKFIEYFVKNGTIDANYVIVAQDDLIYTSLKADALVAAIKNVDNFHPLIKIHRRDEWNAANPKRTITFNRTMDWIMLTHTVSALCTTLTNCISYLKSLQNYHMNNNFNDIFANFLIGGDDGLVFEGRGWDNTPEHRTAYNFRTIGIGLIGDFSIDEPNEMILNNMIRLFDEGLLLGKLTDDYIINGQSDYFATLSPGEGVMKYVREWCRYGNRTRSC